MACAFPWVKDQHIPNIFQHCPSKWGEGEVTRNVAKKYIKKIRFIYIRTKCSKF